MRRTTVPLLALLTNANRAVRTSAAAAPIVRDLSELPYNEDHRLATHIFAYPAGPCAQLINTDVSMWDGNHGHAFVELDGLAYRDVFGHLGGTNSDAPPTTAENFRDCPAVCLEKGTDRNLVARPLPHRYWQYGKKDDEGEMIEVGSVNEFFGSDSCGRVEYGFVNYWPNTVKIYWINHDGVPTYNQDLERGDKSTSFITTFVGHRFQIYDALPNEDALTNEMLEEVVVPNVGIFGIRNHEFPHVPKEGVEGEVRNTLSHEWSRHLMVKRTFSPLGFSKGRLPDDMYASLGAYYYNNRNPPNKIREEWTSNKGVFVNYWETDCK